MQRLRTDRRIGFLALATLAVGFAAAIAGPLTPPAGPVAPTPGPEPRIAVNAANTPGDVAGQFKITQPGSYYLASDMVATIAGNPAILIAASDVTLDLSGFSLRVAAAEGIRIGGDRVTIRNGRVAMTSGADAVYILTGADDTVLEDLTVSGAGSAGVRVQVGVASLTMSDCVLIGGQFGVTESDADTASTLTKVQCRGQSRGGIYVGDRSVLDSCIVRDIGNAAGVSGVGINCGIASTVRNCQVLDATGAGAVGPAVGMQAGAESTIDGCTVFSQGDYGVSLTGIGSTLRNSHVRMAANSNTAVYSSGARCFITDNFLFAPFGTGINLSASASTTIARNHITNATTAVTAISLSSNLIGPAASNGNPTASTNPHANFIN